MTGARVLIYVQHLLGVGHLRRAALIARGLADAGLEVHVASGGLPVPGLALGRARLHQLPPARSAGDGDWSLVDAEGAPVDAGWQAARRERLLALFHELRPAALVVETFPFGRRRMRFELLPLLEAAQAAAPRPLVLSSVRDILQPPRRPERATEAVAMARALFDAVLVHGDPALARLEDSYPAAREIAGLLHYTGYVGEPPAASAAGSGAGEVLVSAGGGAVGARLLTTAVAARPRTALAGATWRLFAGHNLAPDAFAALQETAGADVIVERARPDFRDRLAGAAMSISQAGYNTVVEILAAGTRAVVVPFAAGGELEQSMRAERLAGLGRVQVVSEAALAPGTLADAVDRAAATAPRREPVDLGGAAATARLVAARLARRRGA